MINGKLINRTAPSFSPAIAQTLNGRRLASRRAICVQDRSADLPDRRVRLTGIPPAGSARLAEFSHEPIHKTEDKFSFVNRKINKNDEEREPAKMASKAHKEIDDKLFRTKSFHGANTEVVRVCGSDEKKAQHQSRFR
ncbi:hypothetical protein DdX_07197 [Ditylenchus destructor]|uniref:Uncharacterized protein n=1 Tax=Ditylenchus destructor TaxID=166010 RepID=A0AAD4R7W5_9BILA|nr:hypothetical protein DdX_07197 [Ditylenchus destructor]